MNEPDFTKLPKQKGDRDPVQQIKHLIFEAKAEARTLRGSFHICIKADRHLKKVKVFGKNSRMCLCDK